MAYDYYILKLNRFAWIVPLVVGVIVILAGGIPTAVVAGISGIGSFDYPFLVGFATWLFIAGALGIVAGIIGKRTVMPLIEGRRFEESKALLLIVAIIGCVCYGAGALFAIQFVLMLIRGRY